MIHFFPPAEAGAAPAAGAPQRGGRPGGIGTEIIHPLLRAF